MRTVNEMFETGEEIGIWIIVDVGERGDDVQGVESDDKFILHPKTDLKNVGSLILILLTLLNADPNTTVTVC